MPISRLDTDIAALYRLPLADFTAARNVLAKQAGARAAEVRALQKPPVAAWAINQLFWQHRDIYDRLIGSARDLRAAHAALLSGKAGDVRSAGKSHEEALEGALKSTLTLLRDAGHPVTDATRQAIVTTLRALPADEAPGQLTKTLQPGGFEMLAGLPVSAKGARPVVAPRVAPATPATLAPDARRPKADAAAIRRAKEAAAEAERAVRLAEHAARREEFEAGRAAREARKAQESLASAREAAREAQEALAAAEAFAAQAAATQAEAEERARTASAALEAARDRAKALRREA